ncbi:lipase family protein [Hydrocarboniclastica marina]|uniref:Lipase family protein n=1 Tax=Hydrocarboniclastica marina TaxID=2259620 RepID=A0A4V1D8U9_9ALTE|nr:lipase family protein [Hydrocarboniclastica marina]QCF26450.1 lipase family protein [Hydrocarboniclastica marina]
MKPISPQLASEIADLVYEVRKPVASGRNDLAFSPKMLNAFDFDDTKSRVSGRSGSFISFFQKTSGFALVGHGKNQYRGHHVIAVRGSKTGHDWLTNGNVGLSTSIGGSAVHSGFNQTFGSMRSALDGLLSPHLASSMAEGVHCVGHSLGGALASLIGQWINHRYRKPVNIYTFGAPRVGMEGFAASSTSAAFAHYRCTHGADPVPNIPLWPFVHAPTNGFEYRLDTGTGISPGAHGMGDSAVPGYRNTARTGDWSGLRQNSLDYLRTPVRLDYERRMEASFSGYWADRISAALITLLKDAGYYSAVLLQAKIGTTLTLYDMLARTLEKIAAAAANFSSQVRGLLGHMLVFAGYVATRVADLTYSFIRWVFDRTTSALYRAVRQAIDRNEQ